MKVRDLRQYIKTISKGNETLELVGSNKEYFLNMMSGQGQKVDALIAGAASFANNAKEQLFYEFVQNAYDASADSVSYTHLRAHETGRNLVCRLLLEKKKKHN